MKSFLITAKYNGRCKACGKAVGAGQKVYFSKGNGVQCQTCGPHGSAAPLPSTKKDQNSDTLDHGQLDTIQNRLSSGEKISSIAKELGISWQRLLGMLDRAKSASKTGSKPEPTPEPLSLPAGEMGANTSTLCSDGVYRCEFESITDTVNDALTDYAQNEYNRQIVNSGMADRLTGYSKWVSNFTKETFMQALSDPSKHLLDMVDMMRKKLVDEIAVPYSPRRRIRRGQEWGEDLDADRWMIRDMNPWDRNVRESQPRRTVTIGCNLVVAADIRPKQLLYRGAAALALADILTSRGLNVGIALFRATKNPTSAVGKAVFRYMAKDHLMPLDVSAVAFAMCEIAFIRIVGIYGGSRHLPGTLSEGMGTPIMLPNADRAGLDYIIDADVLCKVSAEQWLRGCLVESEVACA